MKDKNSVLIFAPFFNDLNHVGGYRIRRIIRWFQKQSVEVNVVSLGIKSERKIEDWGTNIIIHSSLLNFLERLLQFGLKFYPLKIIYIVLKFIIRVICIPDERMLWSKKVIKSKEVLEIAKNVSFNFSSSSPESSHVASFRISKITKKPYIIDMRDGWLDEPLKPNYITNIPFRKNIEANLESKILAEAEHIFVSTNNWMNLLINRFPELKEKTTVLTNAYPAITLDTIEAKNYNEVDKIILFYAGRFSGSRDTQKASYLFEPFEKYLKDDSSKVNVQIYGNMRRADKLELEIIKTASSNKNYSFSTNSFIPQSDLIIKLTQASGLLLLSVSTNVIPVKFFEYVITKKPVLAITNKSSTIWDICSELPQFYLYNLDGDDAHNKKVTEDFLKACSSGNYYFSVPEKYSEDYLGNVFCRSIENILSNQ